MQTVILLDNATSHLSPVGSSEKRDGVTVRRYRKEIIRVGHFVHAADGIEFDVTPETLSGWAATFADMMASGNRVSIPLGHKDWTNPERTRGTVLDMFVDGEGLFAIMELAGDDVDRYAATCDVSIYAPQEWTDGNGTTYAWPIRHVAIVPNPAIPGLAPFEEITAADDSETATLTRHDGDETMALDLTKLAAALDIKEELTDDNAETLIMAAIDTLKKAATKKDDDGGEGEGEKPKAPPVEAGDTKPTPIMLSMGRKARTSEIDALVSAGKITPATAKKLADQYASDAAVSLALSGDGDGFDATISALAELPAVHLGGEKSGPQVKGVELSDGNADDDAAELAAAQREARMSQGYPVDGDE